MPKSSRWLKEYRRTIGGSRAAAIMGKSPWKTRRQAYDEMAGVGQQEDISDSPDIRRGTLMEPLAIKELQRQTGIKVKPWPQSKFWYDNEIPFAHALPDAADSLDNPMELAEVKVPRPATWQKMFLDGVPEHYQIQAHHQMMVTGCKVVHFAALCPVTMQILYVPIYRDRSIEDEIWLEEEEFWEALQKGIPPEEETPPVLDLPPIGGSLVHLHSDEAIKAALAYRDAKSLLDEAEEIVNDAKARLLGMAGDSADAFEVDGVLRCYHRLQDGRTTFDHKSAIAANPDLTKYLKTGKPFRSFRAYPLH